MLFGPPPPLEGIITLAILIFAVIATIYSRWYYRDEARQWKEMQERRKAEAARLNIPTSKDAE